LDLNQQDTFLKDLPLTHGAYIQSLMYPNWNVQGRREDEADG
jgi:hypothetical protein